MKKEFPFLPHIEAIAKALLAGDLCLGNVRGAALAKAMADLLYQGKRSILLVVPEAEDAEAAISDFAIFGRSAAIHHFPAWDLLPEEAANIDWEMAGERLRATQALVAAHLGIVVAPAIALLQPTPAPPAEPLFTVATGDCLSPAEALERLVATGFANMTQVEAPGQICRRGGIVDVFPFFADRPLRLEFDGDRVASVRAFDPITQLSDAPDNNRQVLVEIEREAFCRPRSSKSKTLFAFLPPSAIIALYHPERIAAALDLYWMSYGPNAPDSLATLPEINSILAHGPWPFWVMPELENEEWPQRWRPPRSWQQISLPIRSAERFSGSLDHVWPEMRDLAARGVDLTIFCATAAERDRLAEMLRQRGGAAIEMAIGHLSHGFFVVGEDGAERWGVIAEHDIFRRLPLRRSRRRWPSIPLADIADIKAGDYVVHLSYGIAKYEGLTTLENRGVRQDYLQLRFADQVKIYVPLSNIDLVQRYIGCGRGRPELSRLRGGQWQRRTAAAARAVKDLAAELLRLQAVRQTQPGICLPPDDDAQREFEASFPYEETPDQLKALAEIKADQMQAIPMDRLLCGDVGFGKTELAIRAAFKAVQAGKQVAVLVPTTLLAEQHARTFQARMAAYPVLIGCLSRLRPPAEQRRLIRAAREGRIDILIGTHRLLSPDVSFKDLGLAIVDEEQRFGVEHKERLKKLRATIDVLTLTATPIPRTLHMALLGLRDISTLATPPADRYAVHTAVVRADDQLVRRAILRELARGGQCYFLHNRVQTIYRRCEQLVRLVPEARFAIAHGQMAEDELLKTMDEFLIHKIDVLVCTTIVEAGLDIPTVNTLIVDDAERYGLADLHQIRGRVGRYRHQAYAYFCVPRHKTLSRQARQRLQAIEEYTELGAGFRLALRDLEIRGAGNLLGVEQSGHIQQIGFDLYCRLLRRAVAELRGEKVCEREPIEIALGGDLSLPPSYIPLEPERIAFYRRLLACANAAELADFRRYLEDRYGRLPPEVESLLAKQELRQKASEVGINYLGRLPGALCVGLTPEWREKALPYLKRWARRCQALPSGRWRLTLPKTAQHYEDYKRAAEDLLTYLRRYLSSDMLSN